MKKIKKTQAKGFYLFSGEVAANNNFIETLDEAKQFLIYANFFLRDYLVVYEYMITRHEWHMIVKLKSVVDICGVCEESDEMEQNVWRVISEQMRLFLSRYVLTVNKMRGRTGTLVHSSYERYYFETLAEVKAVIEMMRQQSFRMYSRKPKYRKLKSHYIIPKKLGRGSIFLCSKEVKSKGNRGRNFLENQYLSKLRDVVLVETIISTKTLHTNSPQPLLHPKIE